MVLLFYCLLLLPLSVWGCVWSLFCYSLLCVLLVLAIILMEKRELVTLLCLSDVL